MKNNKGLTTQDLWDVAKIIVDKQKSSNYIDNEDKKQINWDALEIDWFDVLYNEVFDN